MRLPAFVLRRADLLARDTVMGGLWLVLFLMLRSASNEVAGLQDALTANHLFRADTEARLAALRTEAISLRGEVAGMRSLISRLQEAHDGRK